MIHSSSALRRPSRQMPVLFALAPRDLSSGWTEQGSACKGKGFTITPIRFADLVRTNLAEGEKGGEV